MSLFNPANPSQQLYPQVQTSTILPGPTGDGGPVDITGFRQVSLQGNVTTAGGAGSTIEVDGLYADSGNWQILGGTMPLSVVGPFRLFLGGPLPPTIRVRWNVVGANPTTSYSLLAQS